MSELNSKKRISINIASSVLQVFVVGVIYLLLYKLLLKSLGIEQLGVWSIILATTSVANLANFGMTSSLVKFIADYNAKNKSEEIPKLIFTTFVSIILFFIVIIVIIFFFSKLLLGYIIEVKYLPIAFEILPYSLLCLFINSIGGVFTSTLDGFQKNYIRNFLMLFSSVFLLLSSYYLIPIYHLKGVAIAQVLQALIMLFGSFFYLKKKFHFKIFDKWNWDKIIFKELMSFGLKFQAISLSQMFYEPITKGLISKFGGLALLGYYEMAARLVNQIRALVVNANQVMIPVVAHTASVNKKGLDDLYRKSMTIIIFVNIILTTGLIVFTPIISILWIGYLEPTFVFSMIVLSVSMLVNIMVGPAYFSCIGEGKLNLILVSHIMIGLLNLALGLLLGFLYAGLGVIVSWGISMIISSVYLIFIYQKQRNIKYDFMFSKYNMLLFASSILISFISLNFFKTFHLFFKNIWVMGGTYILLFVVASVFLIIKRGMLKELYFNKKIS